MTTTTTTWTFRCLAMSQPSTRGLRRAGRRRSCAQAPSSTQALIPCLCPGWTRCPPRCWARSSTPWTSPCLARPGALQEGSPPSERRPGRGCPASTSSRTCSGKGSSRRRSLPTTRRRSLTWASWRRPRATRVAPQACLASRMKSAWRRLTPSAGEPAIWALSSLTTPRTTAKRSSRRTRAAPAWSSLPAGCRRLTAAASSMRSGMRTTLRARNSVDVPPHLHKCTAKLGPQTGGHESSTLLFNRVKARTKRL
mmetsp:Transcript_34204/g.86168  ORF Transcript_34204/g.86168 Transcript_34204/m.86168 type:complete len:253 (-) Transcript_34204:68-826(-)